MLADWIVLGIFFLEGGHTYGCERRRWTIGCVVKVFGNNLVVYLAPQVLNSWFYEYQLIQVFVRGTLWWNRLIIKFIIPKSIVAEIKTYRQIAVKQCRPSSSCSRLSALGCVCTLHSHHRLPAPSTVSSALPITVYDVTEPMNIANACK